MDAPSLHIEPEAHTLPIFARYARSSSGAHQPGAMASSTPGAAGPPLSIASLAPTMGPGIVPRASSHPELANPWLAGFAFDSSSTVTSSYHPLPFRSAVSTDWDDDDSEPNEDMFSIVTGTSWSSGIPGPGYLSGKAIKWIGSQVIRAAIPVEVQLRFTLVNAAVRRAISDSRKRLTLVGSPSQFSFKYSQGGMQPRQHLSSKPKRPDTIQTLESVSNALQAVRVARRPNLRLLTCVPEVGPTVQQRAAYVQALLHGELLDVLWTLAFQRLLSETHIGAIAISHGSLPDSVLTVAHRWAGQLTAMREKHFPLPRRDSDVLSEAGLYDSLFRFIHSAQYNSPPIGPTDMLCILLHAIFCFFVCLTPVSHEDPTNWSEWVYRHYWAEYIGGVSSAQKKSAEILDVVLDCSLEIAKSPRADFVPRISPLYLELLLLFASSVHAHIIHPLYMANVNPNYPQETSVNYETYWQDHWDMLPLENAERNTLNVLVTVERTVHFG